MYKIEIRPRWQSKDQRRGHDPLPQLLELLGAMHEEGHLAGAAQRLGLSYRHAWRLIKLGAQMFGAPLVTMTRGRGTTLTVLGTKLLWAEKRITARLAPVLDSLASEIEAEIERALADAPAILRVQASHAFAIDILRSFLTERHIPIDLRYRGSLDAVASLDRANCDLAGFHVPLGELQYPVFAHYARWLTPDQPLIHLVTRTQGLIVARGNPLGIRSVADLAPPGVRFVNRQVGSGTRLLLDLLLQRANLTDGDVSGYDSGEATHAAVAACIASGLADAGLGIETAAHRFHLEFVPIVNARYFLTCRADVLDSTNVSQVLEILRSAAYRAAVGALSGLDASDAGNVTTVGAAFPHVAGIDGAEIDDWTEAAAGSG
jgi:molybdate transport repressor ModE-like protein